MVTGVLLAAGASTRMGSPKALLLVGGRPALENVADALRQGGCDEVLVVLGAHADEVRAGTELGDARIVTNDRWASGRTSSVQAGLASLPPDADAALLALVDMPLVGAATVATLLDAWRAAPTGTEVVLPVHDGRRGHPIVLARALFPRIAALGPDQPLREVVRAARALEVPVPDPGVLIDFDRPEDVSPNMRR